jgi:hypothetical protein
MSLHFHLHLQHQIQPLYLLKDYHFVLVIVLKLLHLLLLHHLEQLHLLHLLVVIHLMKFDLENQL